MAGNKQHILPRFLLKGFASRIDGEKKYTWVYPKNSPPVEANIRKVCVEKHFYGKQGELSVDEDITKFENEYAPFLDELRECTGQIEIFDPRVPNLITHLVTRTKHFRDSYRESVEFLIEKMGEYFSDFNNLKEAILSTILNKPEMTRDAIEEGFRDHPELKPFENIIRPLFPTMFLSLFDAQKADNQLFIEYFFENINNKLPKLMKDGHIKALLKGLTPEPRVEDYNQLKWYLYNTDDSLILGDIACLSEVSGSIKYKSFTFNDDEIINIFLPISDTKLLIGTSSDIIPQVKIENINEAIAKCSREFFIYSKNCQNITSLIPLIGKESEIISEQEIKHMVNEIILEYKIGLLN
jgi:hypothetical protein